MDYLYRYMQCNTPYSRAIFHEQSQESFQKAFLPENLVSSTDRLSVIESGRARSTGDFIVGMNLTVACTLKYPNNGVLSIGRVQTAVLNMIVQRENEIHDFKKWVFNFIIQLILSQPLILSFRENLRHKRESNISEPMYHKKSQTLRKHMNY